MNNQLKQPRGVIAIITLLGVSAFALAVIGTLTSISLDELKMANAGGVIDSTFYAAEAGLNEGLYRLITSSAPTSYSIDVEGVTVNISVLANPAEPKQRIVRSQAVNGNGNIRTVQAIANTSSFAGGFDYAVQGGSGGIYLDNNSEIHGDVYSNGGIFNASMGARGYVSGDATSATASGVIQKIDVIGDAYSHTITNSDIEGDAYYQVIDAASDVGPNDAACINTYCHPGSSDQPTRDFPIDDDDIQGWRDEIDADGSVINPNPASCPVGKDSGFYCIESDETLGLVKINGSLYVGNGATLTLDTSRFWVTGDLILDNNGTINVNDAISSSLCPGSSTVIIVEGQIDISPNYLFEGCRKRDSDGNLILDGNGDPIYVQPIIIISMSSLGLNPSEDPDIYASNNSDSIIFAALHGLLKVKNGGDLNAAAAHRLELEPNAVVTFDSILSSFVIGTGGGEDIGVSLGTWQEL